MAQNSNENLDKNNPLENTENVLTEGMHHVSNPVLAVPIVEKKYLGKLISFYQDGNSFIFTDGTAKIAVIVVTDEIIRIRMAPGGNFLPDFSYAFVEPQDHVTVFTFKENDTEFEVKTALVTCKICKENAHISFSNNEGKIVCEDAKAMHWEINDDFGGYYVYCSKFAQEDEAFYGLGDKPTHLNLRNKRFKNWNSDTYSFAFDQDPLYRSIPFYIGLTQNVAYGIFFDNTFKTYFDFAKEDEKLTSFWSEGGELNYYYINGPQMIDVIKKYHSITGTHYLPPLWALGFHQCRWSYYPEAKVREIAHTFREKKIPCDAIYLDIDYMDGYRCFTWDRKLFPNPKQLVKDLYHDGFKTVVIIDPGIKVDENYSVYQEGKENEYFCRRGDDYFMEGYVWPGNCRFPDFTNPSVRNWWGGLFKGLVDVGVAGIWNDMNEPAVFGRETFPNDVRHHFEGYKGSHRKAHNVYGMQMVRATYDGLKKLLVNKRPFTITRAAYAGTQRYSSVWTGDNYASWEHLRIGILQLQRMAMSGISFCGTDIGGFSGNPDGELFTRWIQFGVFSPFMRAHSSGDTIEREPWSFGEPFEAIIRKFIELRYIFLPYIYSVFWEHLQLGAPILRPIIMHEQEHHTELAEIEDGYTFGSKIFVSPVCETGQIKKEVYIPVGTWFNYWNHQQFEGQNRYWIETPLDSMPIFIKAGTVMPLYPVMQNVRDLQIESLELRIYYSAEEKNSYTYEDYGDGYGYESQVYMEKKFVVRNSDKSFIVHQSRRGTYEEQYDTYSIKFIGLPFKVQKLLVDGKDFPFSVENDTIMAFVPKKFTEVIIH